MFSFVVVFFVFKYKIHWIQKRKTKIHEGKEPHRLRMWLIRILNILNDDSRKTSYLVHTPCTILLYSYDCLVLPWVKYPCKG